MPFVKTCVRCGHHWQEIYQIGDTPAKVIGTDSTIPNCTVCIYLSDIQAAALLSVAPTIT